MWDLQLALFSKLKDPITLHSVPAPMIVRRKDQVAVHGIHDCGYYFCQRLSLNEDLKDLYPFGLSSSILQSPLLLGIEPKTGMCSDNAARRQSERGKEAVGVFA